MRLSWLKNFRIGKRKVSDDQRSLAQLENLLPGLYYRLTVEPEVAFTHIGEDINQLLGYEAKELSDKATIVMLRQLHPEYQEILETKKKLCSQDRKAKRLEYHLYTKSKALKLVNDYFIGEYNGAGRLIAINGYFKEVKRSRVKRELVNQLEAYRAAIDVNIISSISDLNRRIIYVNENFKRASKYSEKEILGKTHEFLNSGYHPPSFVENLWQTVLSGKMWHGEIQVRAKDGSLKWVDTVVIPTFDGHSKVTSFLFLSVLINERKQAEELRQKYINILDELAHSVAHDLRGPVSTILGLANVVKASDCINEEMNPVKEYIVTAATKLDQITRKFSAKIHSLDAEMKTREIKSTLEFVQNDPGE